MTTYTITDQNANNRVEGLELDQIVEAITPWFPEAPQDVYDTIATLVENLNAGQPIYAEEAALGIDVDFE